MSDCDYLEGWNNGEAHATSNNAGWPRPIPVGERLPALWEMVLVYDGSAPPWKQWTIAEYTGGFAEGTTHWMPLPPKPV